MSTSEEIQAVYEEEIAQKTKLVERKFGKAPFYKNFKDMRKFKLMDVDPCQTKYQGEK